MGLLRELGQGQEYFKGGALGFTASGKTTTMMKVAVGIKQHFKLPGPLGMYDTEAGSEFIKEQPWFKKTGLKLIGHKGRSFSDLVLGTKEAIQMGISVWVVDSITHLWLDLCRGYMKRVNDARLREGKAPRDRMSINDIQQIKEIWSEWSDLYTNGPMHMIVCGRAGFIWKKEMDEETGELELTQGGVKMKVETEFGFEPNLLVLMEHAEEIDRDNVRRLVNRATVLKDKFDQINGKTCDNPDFEFFRPVIERLVPGSHNPIDMETKADGLPINEMGNVRWREEKRTRVVLCEEISGLLTKHAPSQTAADKTKRLDLMKEHFGTRSWSRIEGMPSTALQSGLAKLRTALGEEASQPLDEMNAGAAEEDGEDA